MRKNMGSNYSVKKILLLVFIGVCTSTQIVMFKHNENHNRNEYSMKQSQIFNQLSVDDKIHSYLLNGFIGDLSKESIEKLQKNENVELIEEDKEISVKFNVQDAPERVRTTGRRKWIKSVEDQKLTLTLQKEAPWGISRISSGTNINKNGIFRYPLSSADDVTVFVLDTGIHLDHKEFQGRAKFGANFTTSSEELDENGHGTHCAGVIGGKSVGIAKKTNLVSVKVLEKNGNGMLSSLVMGIDFVIRQHSDKMEEINRSGKWFDENFDEFVNMKNSILSDMLNLSLPNRNDNMVGVSYKYDNVGKSIFGDKKGHFDDKKYFNMRKYRKKFAGDGFIDANEDFSRSLSRFETLRERKPLDLSFLDPFADRPEQNEEKMPKTIVNMSVGGLKSKVLDYALKYATDMGIHFSVAAGNDHENACKYSPGSNKMVITAGASTKNDTVAFFSNYGQCVDLYAPGVEIESSWIKNQYKVVSGTSMAAPHVTGAMALYLSEKNYTPPELIEMLKSDSYTVIKQPGKTEREFPLVSIRHLLREIRKYERNREE